MLINLVKRYASVIKSHRILQYELNGPYLRFKAEITFKDKSVLFIRQTVIKDKAFKYAYHWENSEGTLICRWDNAPHWPEINTFPDHIHLPDDKMNIIVKESIAAGDLDLIFEQIASKLKK